MVLDFICKDFIYCLILWWLKWEHEQKDSRATWKWGELYSLPFLSIIIISLNDFWGRAAWCDDKNMNLGLGNKSFEPQPNPYELYDLGQMVIYPWAYLQHSYPENWEETICTSSLLLWKLETQHKDLDKKQISNKYCFKIFFYICLFFLFAPVSVKIKMKGYLGERILCQHLVDSGNLGEQMSGGKKIFWCLFGSV